ncbi:MAG: hypothetical protein R3F61_00895 [Myxococcota bacterium]
MYTVVEEPVPATALILDIRGFTTEMSVTVGDSRARLQLLEVLAAMNGAVVQSVLVALPPPLRGRLAEYVHVGSTGDGAIVIFLHEDHARHATLATLLIRSAMLQVCERYTEQCGRPLAFGIGVESGCVNHVGATLPLKLGTYIGECINAAARAESLTKEIHRTEVIFCSELVGQLADALLQADYPALMRGTEIPAGSISDGEYLDNERAMVEVNRRLCVNYLHMHLLRGFGDPIALFRLSKSSAALGNPRFDRLIELLVEEDGTWMAEVRAGL